jgi:hypothetical protein
MAGRSTQIHTDKEEKFTTKARKFKNTKKKTKIIRLSGKNMLYRLWERLPAVKLNDRGWKPLQYGFLWQLELSG